MPLYRQIHTDIPKDDWQRIYDGTALWKLRSDSNICRYALRELYAERNLSAELATPGPMLACDLKGKHLQVRAIDQAEAEQWDALVEVYGSGNAALRQALGLMLASFTYVTP